MELNTRDIVYDLFLIEFFERVNYNSYIIGEKELLQWCKYFREYSHKGIAHIPYWQGDEEMSLVTKDNYFINLESMLHTTYPFIVQILELGKGKMCLYDGNLLFIQQHYLYNFYFYFYSCTILEATNLLLESLNILEALNATYDITDNNLWCYLEDNTIEVVFHFGIFKNESDMLQNVGTSIESHAYNLDRGYFSTISGAISVAIKGLPINSRFKNVFSSLAPELDFSILFPGINKELKTGDIIALSNGKIEYDHCRIEFADKPSIIRYGTPEVGNSTYNQIKNILPSFFLYNNIYKKPPNIEKWIDEYKVIQVGITDDRYVAFSCCKIQFHLNNDIFRILCNYWLRAEYLDVRQRLLSLSN